MHCWCFPDSASITQKSRVFLLVWRIKHKVNKRDTILKKKRGLNCKTLQNPMQQKNKNPDCWVWVCLTRGVFVFLLFFRISPGFWRSGVSGEMEFLSAWIVSPSTLPFLCLIWGKIVKCHHRAFITVTLAFSRPIFV